MDAAVREKIIKHLGDASETFLALAEQAETLAPKVTSNSPEWEELVGILQKMIEYLALYGFTLVPIVICHKVGCTLRLYLHDNPATLRAQ